jgi:hypothetical protein
MSSNFGRTWLIWIVCMPACLLACVALYYIATFLSGFAADWGEVWAVIMIAACYVAVIFGLPTLAALLEYHYYDEARLVMVIWLTCIVAAMVGIILYLILHSGTPMRYQYAGGGLSQIAYTLGIDRHLMDRMASLAFSILATAGAAMLVRWTVLGFDWSQPVAAEPEYAPEAAPEPQPQPQPQPQQPTAPVDQTETFATWVAFNLTLKGGSKVFASEAYKNYSDWCATHGLDQLIQDAFSRRLTALQEASGGLVEKYKTAGLIAYRGWELRGSDTGVTDAEFEPIS